jgi:hypothetical protein
VYNKNIYLLGMDKMTEDKKNKIVIKPKNRGKFTSYCESKGYNGVTGSCISEGKKSALARIRKQAIFAENARKFNKN